MSKVRNKHHNRTKVAANILLFPPRRAKKCLTKIQLEKVSKVLKKAYKRVIKVYKRVIKAYKKVFKVQ